MLATSSTSSTLVNSVNDGSPSPLRGTIIIASTKGGSGKTTAAVGLYDAARAAGINVELIDADAQHSASYWLRNDPELPVIQLSVVDAAARLAERRSELTIIDTAGSDAVEHSMLFERADLILLPLSDSRLDYKPALALFKRVYGRGEGHVKFLFCNIDRETSVAYRLAQAAPVVSSHSFQTVIPRRAAVKHAIALGHGLSHLGPAGEIAERFADLLVEIGEVLR